MIDLRQKGLPETVEVDGKPFKIKTDFREWLKFSELIKEQPCYLKNLAYLFENEIPNTDFSEALITFYMNENLTPNYPDKGGPELIDYIEDGEYIYASFLAEYGIDLIDVDMHWWKFKALFLGLSDDSKIKEIMAMRAYRKSNKSPEKIAEDNKRAWSLKKKQTQNEKEIMEGINKLFYNC